MENFILENPTRLVFGRNTIETVGSEIGAKGCRNLLLVAGGGSIRSNGVYERATASLASAGIQWGELWGVQPNPTLDKALEGVAEARKRKVDGVLAIGGGSAIDTAKAIAAGVFLEDLWQAYEETVKIECALPVFVILTLSATGSEMNHFAVLTHQTERKKWGLGSRFFYPTVSIVDPSAQLSLPWEQTRNGAIDAMSHVMEFYFSARDQETALALDESLLRSIVVATDRLQQQPQDYASRANLAWAATLALNGVSGATMVGDFMTHGLEHTVSAFYPQVAHGAGLGVIHPAWIEYMEPTYPATFARWARNVWDADSVKEGTARMRSCLQRWGAATRLRELGVDREQIPAMAASIPPSRRKTKLKEMALADLEAILNLSW
ncbi:MAG: iron-containing alcohol dehydrogenase [Coprothermobacterota bacterium]|nr:iron-containing alcohol dehydrogenase [Coprothermobacterota bacterium]